MQRLILFRIKSIFNEDLIDVGRILRSASELRIDNYTLRYCTERIKKIYASRFFIFKCELYVV